MPRIVYGVMSAHPAHEITIPQPNDTARFGKPNACNQSHLDWSVNRAIAESRRLWPEYFENIGSGDERFDEPEGRRALFAGDAVVRALTAAAVMPANDNTTALLIEAMQDPYPIVRYFVANDLAARCPELRKPDYLAPAQVRDGTLEAWQPRVSPDRLQEAKESRERLSTEREEHGVQVGE